MPAVGAESLSKPRAPAGAGYFYPAERKKLADLVRRLLASELPRRGERPRGRIVGLLVPHAGLDFTGAAAARVYDLLPNGGYDTVVILGAAHHRLFDGAAIYPGLYATPEGSLPYDRRLAEALAAADPVFRLDAAAHEGEHSIEVQIPFLRRRLGRVPTVAVLLSTQELEAYRRVGETLALVLKGRRALIIATSDLSQYPSGAEADRIDASNLLAMSALDPGLLWKSNRLLMSRGVPDLKAGLCGEGAVGAMLIAAKALGATESRVLARFNSGDVVSERDYKHVVGYASAAFFKGSKTPADPLLLSDKDGRELLAAARGAVAKFLGSGQSPTPGLSEVPRLNLPGAVAVSLRAPGGAEFGRSADERAESSLLESAVQNAALAAKAAREGGLKPEAVGQLRVAVEVLPAEGGGKGREFSE